MTIYNSYINSNFNYCSVVWMLSNKTNLKKLENTNKRALRFVTSKDHLSYEAICEQEDQLNIQRKCIKATAIMMYKIRKGLSPSYLNELFSIHTTQYEMRDNERYSLPAFNTVQYGKNSIRYLGAKLWNNIPVNIKTSVSLNTFKSAIHKWLLTRDVTCIM